MRNVELALFVDHDLFRGWRLILGPQPADEALGLFGPAFLVELDQAGEDLLVGQIRGQP
jgi:hypothetical protein